MSIAAAAQSQRRQERVIDVADAAEGRRRVPDDAHRRDTVAKAVSHLLGLAMDGGRMAKAVEADHLVGDREAFVFIFRLVEGKDRRKLFPGERFFFAYGLAVYT